MVSIKTIILSLKIPSAAWSSKLYDDMAQVATAADQKKSIGRSSMIIDACSLLEAFNLNLDQLSSIWASVDSDVCD
jgi:hypothetical protein